MMRTTIFSALALCAIYALADMAAVAAQPRDSAGLGVSLPVGPDQALDALQPASEPIDLNAEIDKDKLKLLMSNSRGPALEVFPKIAPSTVVVRTASGHGTGFVVDADGWIVTNNHVIKNAGIDIATSARWAFVHFGRLEDGIMILEKEGIPAHIYAASPQKDLALLKLTKLPQDGKLQPIALAEKNAAPGTDCVTIGHPTKGLFWSVRSGEIVGVGKYPHDLIDNVMPLFSLAKADKENFAESLRKSTSRKVVLSTCGINPGDSGGPLVNTKGELIAVNFAIPKLDKERGINLDKFSYHVHLDEVKDFIAVKPESPEVYQPGYWPPATKSHLLDKDGDKEVDSWMFAIADDQPPTGLFFDLDGDTPKEFLEDYKAGKADRETFDFEVAYNRLPQPRLFYDRDNDGEVDMILVDVNGDGYSDLSVAKEGGAWKKIDAQKQAMFDAALLADEKLHERFDRLVLNKKADEPPAEKDSAPDAAAPDTQ